MGAPHPRAARRRRRARRPGLLAIGVLAVLLTGCASAGAPDPQLVSLVGDARSAAQTARLGLGQDEKALLPRTTASVVYQDMAEDLADTGRELELADAASQIDARYRSDALAATRMALEGVHAAEHGRRADASRALAEVAEALAALERR
jgi:hypothetical protein